MGRPGEQSIHRVFVDPGGSHCIASVVGGGTSDTFYTHAKWAKPRILGRLKGLIVNAVAWNKQHITEGKVVTVDADKILFNWLESHCIFDQILVYLMPLYSFHQRNYSWYRQWPTS